MLCRTCGTDKPSTEFYADRGRYRRSCKSCHRAKGLKHYGRTRDQQKARSNRWYVLHRERGIWLSCKATAKKRGATEFCTFEEWTELRKEPVCSWCGCWLHPAFRQVDHIVPLCRGGQHIRSNLAASCANCNTRREWERKVKYHAEVKVSGTDCGCHS